MRAKILILATPLIMHASCSTEEEPVANKFERQAAEIENKAAAFEAQVENEVSAAEARLENEADELINSLDTDANAGAANETNAADEAD